MMPFISKIKAFQKCVSSDSAPHTMGFISSNARIVSLLAILVQVFAITTRLDGEFSSGNHPIYLGTLPIPDWEIGLREAIFQALTSERSVRTVKVKNLEEYIHQAPLLGRQNYASPFGDIAIIARGQLYSAPGGFELLQDLYHNDCDGCHNKPPKCGRVQCENWKPYDHERLLALWSVKRIRHRDQKFRYRYEFEYKVSPMSMVANERFVTRDGNFDYSVSGLSYLAKADPEQTFHRPPDSFVVQEEPNWNENPSQYLPPPAATQFYDSDSRPEGYPGGLYDAPRQPHYTTTTEADVSDKDFEKDLFNGLTSKTTTTRQTTTNFREPQTKMTTPLVKQTTPKPQTSPPTTQKTFLPTIVNDLQTTSKEVEQNESAQATSILTEITPILNVTENMFTSTTIKPTIATRTTMPTRKPQFTTRKQSNPNKSSDDFDIFGDDDEPTTKRPTKPSNKNQEPLKSQSSFQSDLFDALPTRKTTQRPKFSKGSTKESSSTPPANFFDQQSPPDARGSTTKNITFSDDMTSSSLNPNINDHISSNDLFHHPTSSSLPQSGQNNPNFTTTSPFSDSTTPRITFSSSTPDGINQTIAKVPTSTQKSLFDDSISSSSSPRGLTVSKMYSTESTIPKVRFNSHKTTSRGPTGPDEDDSSEIDPFEDSTTSSSNKASTKSQTMSKMTSKQSNDKTRISFPSTGSETTTKKYSERPLNGSFTKVTTSENSNPTKQSGGITSTFPDYSTTPMTTNSKQSTTKSLKTYSTTPMQDHKVDQTPIEDVEFNELTTEATVTVFTPPPAATTLPSVQTKTTGTQTFTIPTKKMFNSTKSIIYTVPLTTRQSTKKFTTPPMKITPRMESSEATAPTTSSIVTIPTWLTTVQKSSTEDDFNTKFSTVEDFPATRRVPNTTPTSSKSTTEELEIVYPATKPTPPKFSTRPGRTMPTRKPPKRINPKPTISTTYLPAAEDFTTKPPLVMPPLEDTTQPPRGNRVTVSKPGRTNNFDDDLFGDVKNDRTTKRQRKATTPRVLVKSQEDDDIFGFDEPPQKAMKRPSPDYNYIDSDIQPPKRDPDPKIIYSDFYSPSSTSSTTPTDKVSKSSSEVSFGRTTITEAPARGATRKSYITSVSYKVNKKDPEPTTPYSTEATTFEVTTETELSKNDEVTINKSELIKIIRKMCNTTKNEADTKALDALALTVLNNAKSITYLKAQQDRMARRAKFSKRRSNLKLQKNRRPP